ncbi:MAG: hypothetical protein WDZ52_01550 [Pseudohongiellaceae bacterium]
MDGTVLTIPKLRFEGKNYELKLNLISENPVLFDLISVVEVAENFAATKLTTYSPEVCQSNLQLFGPGFFVAASQRATPPLGYKGDFFGAGTVTVPTSTFPQSALVSKKTGTILALTDTQPPGLGEKARLRLPPAKIEVAPDLGQENDPDYPVVFSTQVQIDSFTREEAIYRSDGNGGLNLVLVSGTDINLGPVLGSIASELSGVSASGEISAISDFRVSANAAVFMLIKLKDSSNDYLLKQDNAGGKLKLLMASGENLNTGSGDDVVRTIGAIEIQSVTVFNQVIAKVEVLKEGGAVDGFAYLNTDDFKGSNQCLATDSSILCNGLLAVGETLLSFSSDGATTGLLIKTAAGQALDYKVIANPRDERLESDVTFQGYSFRSFLKPQVCESRNALYFVGRLFELPVGFYDELFRIDELNNLTKITDFKSLLLDSSLNLQVPDRVINWTIGSNCDAILYMWGKSEGAQSQGYEGHWASYLTGETVEILDETGGRPNGNGVITSVSSSSSNIDSSIMRPASAGAEGEFYFVPRIADPDGSYLSTYAIASKPSCP